MQQAAGLGQGGPQGRGERAAVAEGEGRHPQPGSPRGAAIEGGRDRHQLGGLEPVAGAAVSRPGGDGQRVKPGRRGGARHLRRQPGIDEQHPLQRRQLGGQLGGELMHAAPPRLLGQQGPHAVVAAQGVADANDATGLHRFRLHPSGLHPSGLHPSGSIARRPHTPLSQPPSCARPLGFPGASQISGGREKSVPGQSQAVLELPGGFKLFRATPGREQLRRQDAVQLHHLGCVGLLHGLLRQGFHFCLSHGWQEWKSPSLWHFGSRRFGSIRKDFRLPD
ncbi:protein of unknown function [Cyanobium sp. NIES-981]|nr:protein of unknown function [Cyanobium sp. NIES-981]